MVNVEKFKNLVLYITEKCQSVSQFGRTVLWKMLYFSDFDYYEMYDKSITGETYAKLEYGPAPRNFRKIIKEMKLDNEIKEIKGTGEYDPVKIIPLVKSNLDEFNANEIKVVDRVIEKLSAMNATQVTAYSHRDMPWKATDEGKDIDYELVFYRDEAYSVREKE